MQIDWTFSAGSVIEAALTIVAVIMAFQRMSIHLRFLKVEVAKLAILPEIVARHDERIKHLERE